MALVVSKVAFATQSPSIKEVELKFEEQGVRWNAVDNLNWPESYPYKPEVKFRIMHSSQEIYLQFAVEEDGVRGCYDFDGKGAEVYTDSCVEFFLAPYEESDIYFNLETNCIGHLLLGKGNGRADRYRYEAEDLKVIRRLSTLGDKALGDVEGNVCWRLTVAVPKSVYGSDVPDFSGRTLKGNFYKCGDLQKVPHYVTWNPIRTENPDYHRPEYFGDIYFE